MDTIVWSLQIQPMEATIIPHMYQILSWSCWSSKFLPSRRQGKTFEQQTF